MKDKSKKISTSKIVLVLLGVLVIIFTIAMIYLYVLYQSVPDTLITCFFAATVGEFGALGWIKTSKIKLLERQWEIEDRQEEKENSFDDDGQTG